jgi:release factor glutamine methyltransferase
VPTPAPSWRVLFRSAAEQLGDQQVARWFLEEASGGAWPAVLDEPVPKRDGDRFASMVERRRRGEPVQYVLGHWSFRGLDLLVDRRVLIPRPETEVVVDVALDELAPLAVLGQGPRHLIAVDLGTGSGAIALSLAAENSAVEVWATDLSEHALAVASANLAGAGTAIGGRVRFVQGEWWDALPARLAGSVSLIVSNPPYVTQAELSSLSPEVSAWEPHEALVAGPSGLEALKAILRGAPAWLSSPSSLVCEIAPHQAGAVQALARAAGFGPVFVRRDLAGRERVLVARWGDARTGVGPAAPASGVAER